MNFNKGAMFGLDARIALAIFGALSVISGAALYSAIQDSKVTAMITQLEELGKSVDAYFLDNSQLMPKHATAKFILMANRLVENTDSLATWNGPYTSNSLATTEWLSSKYGDHETVQYRPNTSWGGADGDATPPTDCLTAPCYLWVSIGKADKNIAHALDLKVDGTSDNKNGRVRLWDYADGTTNIYYQYSIAPVQP